MLKLGMVFPYTPLNLKTYTVGTSSSTKGYLQGNKNIERTLAKILVPALEVKCHKVTLKMKLLIISVTLNTPQNMVRNTITHVTLNTMNGVVQSPSTSSLGLCF